MAYDVLDDSIYDSSSKRRGPKKGNMPILNRINPFYIHLLLVIVLIGVLLFIVFKNFDFGSSEEKNNGIVLVGDLNEFNKTYSGDLKLFSSKYVLEVPSGKFDEGGREFLIEDFNGSIVWVNNSIEVDGVASKISFGNNEINIGGDKFSLSSTRKTVLTTYFSSIDLDFDEGRVKLGSVFNYELYKSNITLTNFNSTMSYDGTFSFAGFASSMDIASEEHGLLISYKE